MSESSSGPGHFYGSGPDESSLRAQLTEALENTLIFSLGIEVTDSRRLNSAVESWLLPLAVAVDKAAEARGRAQAAEAIETAVATQSSEGEYGYGALVALRRAATLARGPARGVQEAETCGAHRGPQGPNEDIGQCPRCWSVSYELRPEGETYGNHLPDCSLPRGHESYCKPGGEGHPPAAHIRGFWPVSPSEEQQP